MMVNVFLKETPGHTFFAKPREQTCWITKSSGLVAFVQAKELWSLTTTGQEPDSHISKQKHYSFHRHHHRYCIVEAMNDADGD